LISPSFIQNFAIPLPSNSRGEARNTLKKCKSKGRG
jgi:hypothetical protein